MDSRNIPCARLIAGPASNLAGGSSAPRSRVLAAAVLQALLATAGASAKVVYEPGFGPPAYPERFLHALVGLGPLGLILFALCAAVMLDFERPASAVRALAVCSIAIVVASSLLVAADVEDNEFWQPWFFGSFFIALIPGVALWLSARRRSRWVALAALLSPVPTWIAMALASLLLIKVLDGSW